MGRGLSDLQKVFLVRAYNNIVSEGGVSAEPCDCFFSEIIANVYGLEPTGLYAGKTLRTQMGGQKFKRTIRTVGGCGVDTRYDSAHAAVSRAARRLEERGLVEIVKAAYTKWTGVRLTEQGRVTARELFSKGYVYTNGAQNLTDRGIVTVVVDPHRLRRTKQKDVPKTVDERIASLANVSARTIRDVRLIEELATEEVKDQLRRGELSISAVARELRRISNEG